MPDRPPRSLCHVSAYRDRTHGVRRVRIERPRGRCVLDLSEAEALALCNELVMLIERDAPDVLLDPRAAPPSADPLDPYRGKEGS